MIEILAQLKNKNTLVTHSEEDQEMLSEYHVNQILSIKVDDLTPVKKRSLLQLRQYWKACTVTALNTDDSNWNTKEKVDLQCRIKLDFKDFDVSIDLGSGVIYTPYRSIAMKNLKHMDACNYINNAFEVMADFLKILGQGDLSPKEILLNNLYAK